MPFFIAGKIEKITKFVKFIIPLLTNKKICYKIIYCIIMETYGLFLLPLDCITILRKMQAYIQRLFIISSGFMIYPHGNAPQNKTMDDRKINIRKWSD